MRTAFWIINIREKEIERERGKEEEEAHVVRECLFLMLNYYCVKLVPRSGTETRGDFGERITREFREFREKGIFEIQPVRRQTRNKNVITEVANIYVSEREERIARPH